MDSDREILVTGGCGSIGSALVGYLLDLERSPRITVYDNDEQSLFAMERETRDLHPGVDVELGDVRDRDRLVTAMRGADYVVHTAGLKQVPHCESHPYEAIRTNADGTRNVVEAAISTDVDSVLTLSTDKAVTPTSTMGATKMLAERITQAAERRMSDDGPRLGCARLGNVVDSAGSVVPLFREQIRDGGPVTVTNPEMTRFAMSKRRAAAFVTDCVRDQTGGRIHTPKIGRFRLRDLAEVMIEEYAPEGVPPEQIEIEVIGRRPGERDHEYLVGPTEVERTVEHDDRYSVRPPAAIADSSTGTASSADLPSSGYRSDTEPYLEHEELVALLDGEVDASPSSPACEEGVAIVGNDDSV